MRMTFEELDSEYQLAIARRSPHERVWQEISEVCMPLRGDISLTRSPGSPRIPKVFDNTAALSANAFANVIKGAIAPSQTNWIRIHAPVHIEENVKIRQLLDATGRRLLRALANSNFYIEFPITLRDDAVVGQGTLHLEQKPMRERRNGVRFTGFNFTAIPPARVWWFLGKDGKPDALFCAYEMTARAAARWLGSDAPDTLLRTASVSATETVKLVHFNHKNHDYDERDPTDSPWFSAFAVYDNTAGRLVKVGQNEFCPYTVYGWTRVDGEEYFRGQGHICRSNARGAQVLMEMVLRGAPRDILPTLMIEENANVQMRLSENGVMVVRPPVKMEPKFLRSGANYQIAYEILERDRGNIREAFFMQFLGNPDTQPRSREESIQRLMRANQQMAAPAESVQTSLGETMQNALQLMHSGHALPEFEEYLEYISADEEDVCEVVFTSPFFAAQKQGELDRLRSFIAETRRDFAETGDPAWLDPIDPNKVNRLRSLYADVDANILRSDEEIAGRRQMRARRDAQQRGLQVAQAAMGRGGQAKPISENDPQGSLSAPSDLEALP